jgi:hypothetical protein
MLFNKDYFTAIDLEEIEGKMYLVTNTIIKTKILGIVIAVSTYLTEEETDLPAKSQSKAKKIGFTDIE